MTQQFDIRSAVESPEASIDLVHYEASGGLADALSRHADEAYASLPDDHHQRIVELAFKRLTELGRDGRAIRRPSPVAELTAVTGASPTELDVAIRVFQEEGRSFLRVSDDGVVDISHESLIRQWPRLRSWAEEEAESREVYTRLADAAERAERGEAAILRGPDLRIAADWWSVNRPNQAWAERHDPDFERASAFLTKSQRAADHRRILALIGIAALAALTVASVVFALRADSAQSEAESQAALALAETERANFATEDAELQRDQAETERLRADAQRIEAEAQTARADEATIEAEGQRALAVMAADEAVRAREAAELALAEAEAQRARAEDALEDAEVQRARAESARGDAEARRIEAEGQRALAVTAARVAETARSEAEVAQAAVVGVLQKITTDLLGQLCAVEDFDVPCIGTGAVAAHLDGLEQSCMNPPARSRLEDLSLGGNISLRNGTGGTVEVNWISPDGVEIPWQTIPPDEFFSVETVVGWTWVLRDSSGRCLAQIGPELFFL